MPALKQEGTNVAELNVKADSWLIPMTVKGFLKKDETLAACELLGPEGKFKVIIHPDLVPFLKIGAVVFVSLAIVAPSIVGSEAPPIQLIKGKLG